MRKIVMIFLLGCLAGGVSAQEDTRQPEKEDVLELSLHQVIDLAQTQSADILNARHTFRYHYWSYVSHKANYLPSLNFSTSPYFNHAINAITQPDGTISYRAQNVLETNATLSINQNIALTGGTVSVYTNLGRIDDLHSDSYSYSSTPIQVSYNQSLFGYNSLKWARKTEPLQYEEAKKNYVEALENIARTAISKYFNLANAQINMNSTRTNYENAKQMYEYAQGRYNIGSISESEMLQLEINMLSAETSLNDAIYYLDNYTEDLRRYLRLDDRRELSLKIDDLISLTFVDPLIALEQAKLNGPDMINMERRRLVAESNFAQTKANNGMSANLGLKFGLGTTAEHFRDAYTDLNNQQMVSVSVSIPILDWGKRKGQIELAKSNREITLAQLEEDHKTFETDIVKAVKQFNMQPNNLRIARLQDEKAAKRSEVARSSYLAGKATILDLNSAVSEKDNAKQNYISALHTYWNLYYYLRALTLFDFEQSIPITQDYKLLIK